MCTMRVSLCLALLVCAMCSASSGTFSTCCTKVSPGKLKPGMEIENFVIQEEAPPCVHAVMFITREGKIICSDPSVRWVKQKIQEISKMNKENNNQ